MCASDAPTSGSPGCPANLKTAQNAKARIGQVPGASATATKSAPSRPAVNDAIELLEREIRKIQDRQYTRLKWKRVHARRLRQVCDHLEKIHNAN